MDEERKKERNERKNATNTEFKRLKRGKVWTPMRARGDSAD
jgi:hypothetical protein